MDANFSVFGINAAGIKSKLKSFDEVLKKLNPKIWMVQETKLKPNEQISCASLRQYQVYYLNRQKSQGGGVALGVYNEIESTLINEGDDDTEVLSVKVFLEKTPVRAISAYAPQENALLEKKEKFWDFLDKEVNNAEIEGDGLIIQMDSNLHAGPELVKDDPNDQNRNGRLFCEFLARNPQLIVVNTLDICEGLITRKRDLKNATEEAVLDFFIVNERLRAYVKRMRIDEDKEYCIMNLAQQKKNNRIIETDHNAMILEMKMKEKIKKIERKEMLNLRNKQCQEIFKVETENNQELLECFDNDKPLESQAIKWKKSVNNILHKCFRKVRISRKREKRNLDMFLTEKVDLKRKLKSNIIDEETRKRIEDRVRQIEFDIGEDVAEENRNAVVDTVKALGDSNNLNGSGRQKLWKLLKNKYPKYSNTVPVGKRDENGRLVTAHSELKKLYVKTYTHRMRNRPMKAELKHLKECKENLFKIRLKLSKKKASEPWNINDLEKALKSLKNDKARDPNDWCNEIFKEGVAGKSLKISLLTLLNKMKEKKIIPKFVQFANISTIYKGKGSKVDLINDRGIFIVTIIRSILMRLVYSDYYQKIDNSMSDSQVGSRKDKNIRNHIWILNGIITDVLSSKSKLPIDVKIYDYKQCFDGLWLQECLNDLYEAGLKDDKFALLYEINRSVNIAVKTPVGMTSRNSIHNVITQGDVISPLFCSKQVAFGEESLKEHKYTYKYRGQVEIPPLSMVDDILSVSECGIKTSMSHAFITFKSDSKKLQFGPSKCKKLHIGKYCKEYKCNTLKVDKWKEVSITNEETGVTEVEDFCEEKEEMEDKKEEKYLGDIISSDGKNIKNVKARVAKGKGVVERIMTMVENIPFGKFYFEVAVILRNSLLISSLLSNSEAWYNVTQSELNLLESVDLILLRKILNAPRTTPKELLYLELGCTPLRDIIRKRRISFLKYILRQDPQSMMYKFLETQLKNRKPKDWVSQVLDDIKELDLNISLEDIKTMKKGKFKGILNRATQYKSLQELNKRKINHSKGKELNYGYLEMQKYLKPSHIKIQKEDAITIFKLRTRMTNVKANFRGNYENLECKLCDDHEDETQQHILKCKKNWSENAPEYEEIFGKNVKYQIEIAKLFNKNIKIRDEIMQMK